MNTRDFFQKHKKILIIPNLCPSSATTAVLSMWSAGLWFGPAAAACEALKWLWWVAGVIILCVWGSEVSGSLRFRRKSPAAPVCNWAANPCRSASLPPLWASSSRRRCARPHHILHANTTSFWTMKTASADLQEWIWSCWVSGTAD